MMYNTRHTRLVLPEHGRYIQDMVAHALTLEDREQRQACATAIIKLMTSRIPKQKRNEEVKAKLWNQLAVMANYALDIDYPYPITCAEVLPKGTLPYPKHPIKAKHYGHLLEELIRQLPTLEDEKERTTLTELIVMQMRKHLSLWHPEVLSDEKIADDIAKYSEGKVQLDPKAFKPSQVNYAKIKHDHTLNKQRKGRKN